MSSHDFSHNPLTLLHIATHLRKCGISPVEIFRRVGVPPSALLNGDGWVSRKLCFALGEEAGIVAGDRFFGSKIGESYSLTELGVWGRTIVGAANVGEACAIAGKTIGLLQQGSDLRFLTFRRHAQLRFAFRGRLGADARQHLIGTLAVLRKVALLGNAPETIRVRFSMPYSRGADCLEETHGSRLEFGCDHDAIVIDRDILSRPLSVLKDSANLAEPAETAAAISAQVKRLLPYGHLTIEAIAAQQRLSVRTLQRRLRQWGFSFEEIVDDVRRTEAIKYVLAGEYSVMDIAFLLGYSDHPHFARAFRRWTGMSPQAYARSLCAESDPPSLARNGKASILR
jgi:AraC-like DNA-binding protein